VRYWVANTDSSWVSYLTSVAPIDEVNFWQPNNVRPITLPEGAPWLFKLHVRSGGVIVGGARFAHYSNLTPQLAWTLSVSPTARPPTTNSFDSFAAIARGPLIL